MDHYVEIDLRPDPEFAANDLMSALYAKLHRALVKLGCADVGVSFPQHDADVPHLGNRLRLHGGVSSLTMLMASEWLSGMRDHVFVSVPSPVPASAKHRQIHRVQAKSNPQRLRRRLMRRHEIGIQEAQQRIPDGAVERLHLPFVQMRSATTDQSFRLFIAHGPEQPQAIQGDFNSYGLSQKATVPWF